VGPEASRAHAAVDAVLQVVITGLRPGASLASVCRAAEEEAVRHGCTLDPHVGHGIGLDPVEPPLLQPGADGSVRPGLVLSLTLRVDPVLLVQTVAVGEGGARVLGRFPI
jgi:Xaa-Pro aminopeptidase